MSALYSLMPLEVWLEVFSYLHYHDLKSCQRVSKYMRACLAHASLDIALFRGGEISCRNLRPNEHVTLHPLFPFADTIAERSAGQAQLLRKTRTGQMDIFCNTTFIIELATMPPVTTLRLSLFVSSDRYYFATNWTGVTIKDVLLAMLQEATEREHMWGYEFKIWAGQAAGKAGVWTASGRELGVARLHLVVDSETRDVMWRLEGSGCGDEKRE